MGDGLREELFDRDAITAHKKRALRLERRRESSDAGMSLWRAPALDLDRHEPTPCPDDEIHFLPTLTPIVERALARGGRIGQMRADAGFDEATPQLAIAAGLDQRKPAAYTKMLGQLQDAGNTTR